MEDFFKSTDVGKRDEKKSGKDNGIHKCASFVSHARISFWACYIQIDNSMLLKRSVFALLHLNFSYHCTELLLVECTICAVFVMWMEIQSTPS